LRSAIRCAIERQHERAALIEEKDNYYGIFDHLVEGVFRTTTDGHYSLANVALARIYGYDSPAELMASIKDIARKLYVEPGRRDEFVRLMQAHDTLSGFESKIYRKDETIIWIAENCRAVRDAEGKLLYYEGTVEDITERKRAEDQIRRATGELSRSREELRAKNLIMEENLRMAREIQTAMLPQQYPTFPQDVSPEESAFQFVHRYEPAESVSGDFFSVSALSDNEVSMFICDVTGHGVRAALVTAMIRALAEELKPLARDPGNVPSQAQFRPVQHPQDHRLADADHGVLSGRRLDDRRHAVRQRRPSEAAAHPPLGRPRRTARAGFFGTLARDFSERLRLVSSSTFLRRRRFFGVASTYSSTSMYSSARSSESFSGGASWMPLPSPCERMLVRRFSFTGFTGMSFSRAFSPTIMPT
jgi:PAS domain S-box-containing protein